MKKITIRLIALLMFPVAILLTSILSIIIFLYNGIYWTITGLYIPLEKGVYPLELLVLFIQKYDSK